jgi:hypothetical protein
MADIYCEIDVLPLNRTHDKCSSVCEGASGMNPFLIAAIVVVSVTALVAVGAAVFVCCRPLKWRGAAGVGSQRLVADIAPYSLSTPDLDAAPSAPPIRTDAAGSGPSPRAYAGSSERF